MLLTTQTEERFKHVCFQARRSQHAGRPLRRHALEITGPKRESREVGREELAFLGDLFERAGLDMERYRLSTLKRRLNACCRALRAPSIAEAHAIVRREPRAVPRALSAVVLGVSEFFRDACIFEQLRLDVLPRLAARETGLRVVSIGCSDGRELYSIAILLAELGLLDGCSLHGIDCRADAIAEARAGQFDAAAIGGISFDLRRRYFRNNGGRYQVVPELCSRTTWSVASVFDLPDLAACDLVLFRNVVIYLEQRWAARAWSRVVPLVRQGGFLITGKAERPPESLCMEKTGPCVYRRAAPGDGP